MGLYTKDIDKIKDAQKMINKIIKGVEKLEKKVKIHIRKEWDKAFPGFGVRFLTGFEGGCMTNKWHPTVWFHGINGFEYYMGEFYEISSDEEDCFESNIKKVSIPIPLKQVRNFLKQLSLKIGVSCILSDSGVVSIALRENKNDRT